MLGDERTNLDKNDDVIDGKKYTGTPGLYGLIFKKIPNETIYIRVLKYTSILLTTNAHKRGYSTHNPIMGNKGHKYKSIIASLMSGKRIGKDISRAVTLNKIDYVH